MGECACKKCGFVSGRKARFFRPGSVSTAFFVCDLGADKKLKSFMNDGTESKSTVAFSLFDAERLVEARLWTEIDSMTVMRMIPGCIFQWDDHDGVDLETGRLTVRITPENEMLGRKPLQELGKKCCGQEEQKTATPVRLWVGRKGIELGRVRATKESCFINTVFYEELFSDGKGGFEIRR